MNTRPSLLCLLFICFQISASPRDNLRSSNMRALAMGDSKPLFSALFNPSLTAATDKRVIKLTYFNLYGVKELGALNSSLLLPARNLSFGFHIASFGYDEYRESLFRFSLAKRLSERLTLGVALQYAMIQSIIYHEAQPSTIAADVGLAYTLSDKLLLAFSAVNFPSVAINEEAALSQFMATGAYAGLRWQDKENIRLSAGLEYAHEQAAISAGLEYELFDSFCVRGGAKLFPFLPSFGIGYGYAQLVVDVASVFHPILGASVGISLAYEF